MIPQGGGFSSIIFHQGGLSSRWSLIKVVSQGVDSHQGGLSVMVFHQGGLSSGWSFIRVVSVVIFIKVVSQQGGLIRWSSIRVVCPQGGLSGGVLLS